MSVKASVSITDQQNDFVRDAVEAGHYSSLSAVVQRGIELVRKETELQDLEIQALRTLLEDRSKGRFIDGEQSTSRVHAMLEQKRKDHST